MIFSDKFILFSCQSRWLVHHWITLQSTCRIKHRIKHRRLLHHLRVLLRVYYLPHLLLIWSRNHDLIIPHRLELLLILISNDLFHTEIIINACFNLHILTLLRLLKSLSSFSLSHFYRAIRSEADSDTNQWYYYSHNDRSCCSVSCVGIISIIVVLIIVAAISASYNNCAGS